MKRFAVLLTALFGAVVFAQDLPKIAVYVTGNVPDDEKKALGTKMLAELVNSGRYIGIERSTAFLAEIDKEQVKQRSGAIDDKQISLLGRQFGVTYVCIADITPALGAFQISARIVDVETAQVAFIGESNSALKTLDDLASVSVEVVRKMFGGGAAQYTITANASPNNGGYVSRNPNQTYYAPGTIVSITATPASGYAFTGWSGSSASTKATLTAPIDRDLTLTANFNSMLDVESEDESAAQSYTLTINVVPSDGGYITRSPDKETYAAGEEVTVTATPASGYEFYGWEYVSEIIKANNMTINMNSDKQLWAHFYFESKSNELLRRQNYETVEKPTHKNVLLVDMLFPPLRSLIENDLCLNLQYERILSNKFGLMLKYEYVNSTNNELVSRIQSFETHSRYYPLINGKGVFFFDGMLGYYVNTLSGDYRYYSNGFYGPGMYDYLKWGISYGARRSWSWFTFEFSLGWVFAFKINYDAKIVEHGGEYYNNITYSEVAWTFDEIGVLFGGAGPRLVVALGCRF